MFSEREVLTLTEMARAFWVNPEVAEASVFETSGLVMLLDLSPEAKIEKAAVSLLARARVSEGRPIHTWLNTQAGIGSSGYRFFLLTQQQRFILVALHRGRWSYERLARILQISHTEIEDQAWAVRMQLGAQSIYPAASTPESYTCPEYVLSRPWTQRFLDEELEKGRESLFLRNHLQTCSSCSQLLLRSRLLYYEVEKIVIAFVEDQDSVGRVFQGLNKIWKSHLWSKSLLVRMFRPTFEMIRSRVQYVLSGGRS